MKTVYLCGPINKCTDSEARDWRETAKERLGGKFNLLDPMRRDYRGRELEPGIAHEIVGGDKVDVNESQIILAYCPKPSVGTSMEIFMAWQWPNKRIVIVHPDPKPSPWLIVHSHKIVSDFNSAFEYINGLQD